MSLKINNFNHNKLDLISEIKNLVKQYYMLVDELSSIFLTKKEKEDLIVEINTLESTIKSKLIISSSMRGF